MPRRARLHEVTTGAANDIEKVTATSKAMIMRYGMSESWARSSAATRHAVPRPGDGPRAGLLDEIARKIDDEIRSVIEAAHQTPPRAAEHMEGLHKVSVILIERETIEKDQFERLLAGEAEESIFPEGSSSG